MTKPTGQIIFDYNEAKKDMKLAADELTKRAVEMGLDSKTAQDNRVALAYLIGITRRVK